MKKLLKAIFSEGEKPKYEFVMEPRADSTYDLRHFYDHHNSWRSVIVGTVRDEDDARRAVANIRRRSIGFPPLDQVAN